MTLVFTSYIKSPEFDDPGEWLKRLEGYTGILESLAKKHKVISIERISYTGIYHKDGVEYHFIEQKDKVNRFPFKAHRLVKQLKPDIVFVNGLIFPFQTVLLRMKLGRSVRIIGMHHAEKPYTGLKKYLQRWADMCFDAYSFTSAEFGSQWKRAGIISDESKVHEIMEVSSSFSPIEKNKARAVSTIKGSPAYIWVGRLDANKDPLTVVKAFLQFATIHTTATLHMIFQTDELLDEIKTVIEQYPGSSKQINLVGKIAHADLPVWYSSADFIISGSHYEGSGTAVCEAMSCGCVPLLTNIVSFRMMTGRGRCGLLYEAGNVQSLTGILKRSLQLDLPVESAKTLNQFKEYLSYDAIAAKIDGMIASLTR